MILTTRSTALLVLIASAALLLGALAFQYLGGLAPCVLCMWQRYAHVATIALAVIAVFAPHRIAPFLLAAAGLALLSGAGIAGFHVGVEQHWWPGTAECGSTIGPAGNIEELRARLMAQPIVRCDEVAWSLFGVSMAGYNLLFSVALGALALLVAWKQLLPRRFA
jgi:disulfide bond formation protein DsbB